MSDPIFSLTTCSIICNFQNIYIFFQAEDGIRDAQESRGLGDVYKRQQNIEITTFYS